MSNRQIAQTMCIQVPSGENYINRLFDKLDLGGERYSRRYKLVEFMKETDLEENVTPEIVRAVADYNYSWENLSNDVGIGLNVEWSRERMALAMLELAYQHKANLLSLEKLPMAGVGPCP